MKSIKTIVGIVISAVIGGIVGFLALVYLSEGLYFIITSVLAAFIVSVIVYRITYGRELSKLFTVFAFIVSGFFYLWLLSSMNEASDSPIVPFIILCLLPYMILSYLILVVAEKK